MMLIFITSIVSTKTHLLNRNDVKNTKDMMDRSSMTVQGNLKQKK